MQTFLPYIDFLKSAKVLDNKRLGKQRVEAKQILDIIEGKAEPNEHGKIAWINHPAVKMWEGYANCLRYYINCIIREWVSRGFKNNMESERCMIFSIVYPDWIGNKEFHDSHKSKLLEKNKEFYSQYNWDVEPDLPYYWPTKQKKDR